MQFIQEACLINFVITSIFSSNDYRPYGFTWDVIANHSPVFTHEYNYYDAQFLLQLSFMITSANLNDKPLCAPPWLEDIELVYTSCPLSIISKGMPNSKFNTPSNLGHVLYNEGCNVLFIIFTGTSNTCMTGLDFAYGQTDIKQITNYTYGMAAHQGIYIAYKSIRCQLFEALNKYLPRNPQIVIAGHSLGGGLSQLCALELAIYNPIHYSFASPLIFNQLGASIFDKLVKYSYRVANSSDLITISPLPIMPNKHAFYHVGKLIHFQRNLAQYSLNHTLAYAQEYNLHVLIDTDKVKIKTSNKG